MSRPIFTVPAALLLAVLPVLASGDALPNLSENGWYSWDTEAVADLPGWCCFEYEDKHVSQRSCDLDRSHDFGSTDEMPKMGKWARTYALIADGQVRRVRTLHQQCDVKAGTPIKHLGKVDNSAGVTWLVAGLSKKRSVASESIAAIASYAGPTAMAALTTFSQPSAALSVRKDAVFWMSQTRPEESRSVLEGILFSAEQAKLRTHAAFSLAQTDLPDKASLLIRLGRNDAVPKVRSSAWFWLAQSGAEESEEAIINAIRNDPSRSVREEAVFALSQLPEERSSQVLIALLQDQSMTKHVREKALFWLANSETDAAMDYIEALILG